VLDTGLDINNQLLTVGSLGGVSFVPGNPSYNDDHGHGTHVTGILAARPGNSSDGKPLYWSIAPGASHFSVKVLDSGGGGAFVQIAQGLDWARNTGVDVISMSLGALQQPPAVVGSAIAAASQNAVIVAAAGNNGPGNDTVNWPARYREVIGVGAVDRNRVIADFSSRGPADPNAFVEDNVECVAPGVDIFSNRLGGGPQDLVQMSGTSMATPMVSAICALLKQKDRSLVGTNGFRFRLRGSFIDLGIPGPDNWYGLGLVHFDPSS
jgi:subtilisin family serine protease